MIQEYIESKSMEYTNQLIPYVMIKQLQFDGMKSINYPVDLLNLLLNHYFEQKKEFIRIINQEKYYN